MSDPVAQSVSISAKPTGASSLTDGERFPGIRQIVAVASGKGGVGKSTAAVNLAVALAQTGCSVGLVDADVHGPSVPRMLGIPFDGPPPATPEGQMVPAERYGVKVASMGMLRGDDNPTVARGPMVSKFLQILVAQVAWGQLDYLVLDLPPGTGDIQLTLAQSLRLSGAVIVTTPQDVSLSIARRGLRMFESVNVPILGIIENMGPFTCSHCGSATSIFGEHGGETMSDELDVPFLGSVPLDAAIVLGGDRGRPIVIDQPASPGARAFVQIAQTLRDELEGRSSQEAPDFNWLWAANSGAPAARAHDGSAGDPATPLSLRRGASDRLDIVWADGTESSFAVRDLRLACRCANCIDEMSGAPILRADRVATDVRPVVLKSVGNYGMSIDWSDGHTTGIYSYGNLRALADSADSAN